MSINFLVSNFSISSELIKEIAKEERRSWPIVERSQVFNRFKHENDLSQLALVIVTVRKIKKRLNKLGKTSFKFFSAKAQWISFNCVYIFFRFIVIPF